MSALQFLREKAGVLVAGLIGFSLFIFVISDFFGRGKGQRHQQKKRFEIGRINGNYISYPDYEQKVQNLQEIYKLYGSNNIDEATYETIRENVWQQIVREKVLGINFKSMGIAVSNEEVDELVLGNDPDPIVKELFTDRQTGQFDKSYLINFLKTIETDETAKKYWLFFENEIVDTRTFNKYNNLVGKGLYVTSKAAEFENNLSLRTADFSFIVKPYSSVSDSSVSVSSEEIQGYYTDHKESYKREAQRDIEYVTFDIIPSEDDRMSAEKWINGTKAEFSSSSEPVQFINTTADTRYVGFYQSLSTIPENLKDFVKKENKKEIFGPYLEEGSYKLAKLIDAADRPDSVHARHILITPDQTMTSEMAKHKADSLIKLIKTGMPFEIIAMANSSDKGTTQVGGDLGWFKEGQMVVPFNNACFTAKKGDITTVETNYGVHIIQVLDLSKKVRKYDIGIIDRKILASSLTNQKVYGDASKFAGTNNTYEKFTKAVAEQNLNKRVADNIAPQQKALPGLDKPRQLIMSLFQAEKGKIILDGSQQAVFEIGDKYVVAYCTKLLEEGPAPIKEVENDIRFTLLKDKKADRISAELKGLMVQGKALEDVASSAGLNVQEATQVNFKSYSVPGAGVEPALIAAASVAEQGVVAGPVKGVNGVYVLTVNNVTTAAAEELKLLKERLVSTFRIRGNYEAYEALRKSANIVDKRYKFY